MRLTGAEIAHLPWSDVSLIGICWRNEGRDLEITVSAPHHERSGRLVCVWVNSLRIDLEFTDFSSLPFTWDVQFRPLEDDRWAIEFDFGGTPRGVIRFECNEVTYERESEA
jgi:hypothetical protein